MTAATTAPVVPAQGSTTAQFDTSSELEVLKGIRRYLLDYQNVQGASARDTIQERLSIVRAQDRTIFPYGILRLQTINDGKFHGMRLDGDLEVLLFGRPWVMLESVSAVADLFDQAMREIVLTHQGLILCHGFQRATLPATDGAPIDSEVCTVRLSYTLAIWPAFLTSLTRVLPP